MPEDVKDEIGMALQQAQQGIRPHRARVLQGFHGASVLEIKDDYDTDTYRCIYTVRFAEAIYVLHSFQKKSHTGSKTPKAEIELIKSRMKEAEEHYKLNYSVKPALPG